MTGKSKQGAAVHKGKKAAAASKSKAESDEASKVVEVSEEQKVSAAEEVKAAPPPEASMQSGEEDREEVDHKPEQNKPTEQEAEAIAEHLVAEARKPLTKNDSQSSLAGSVTVGTAALFHRLLWHSRAGIHERHYMSSFAKSRLHW